MQPILKGGYTMVSSNISPKLAKELEFSADELHELEAARKLEITFDADCPEVTPEKALKFRRVNPPRNSIKGA